MIIKKMLKYFLIIYLNITFFNSNTFANENFDQWLKKFKKKLLKLEFQKK